MQINFPYQPQHTDWQTFNGNLIMHFGQTPIPISSEEEWHITANNIIQTPALSKFGIAGPEGFDNWQDWAGQFIISINGQSRY